VEGGTEERQPENKPATSADSDGSMRLRFVRWSYRWVWLVVVIGVLATAGLGLISAELASSNERHLLKLRSKEVGSVLTSALPDVQTPLGAAVALADITGADTAKFSAFAATYVGAGRQFTSMSVWRVGHLGLGPVVVVGAQPELSQARGGAVPILRSAAQRTGAHAKLSVRGLLHATQPRLAYAYAGSRPGAFLVEAEQALPKSRYTRLPANSAYSNLNIAVYIAKRPTPSRLLLSTVRRLPLPGPHAIAVVPFGSDTLEVVVSARQPLGGTLPELMPWVIALLGVLLTVGAGILTFRLIWGGGRAQRLAAENRQLYAEQRQIARRVQEVLLPEDLPQIDGLNVVARYQAGMPGVDIGGDWYDMIQLGSDRLLLVVGDVSGRGIRAAAAMASLRSAIQYAAQTEPPEAFLPKLSGLHSLHEQGQLATVLCLVIGLQDQRVSVTSAGHLPPLLVHDGRGEFLQTEVGLPIGVDTDSSYVSTSFTVPSGACLFGFTDGLVERHGESLDDGLERLRHAADGSDADLHRTLARIIDGVRAPGPADDKAIVGVQWAVSKKT
jgi:Stage II sporulation protein E (SpoIIE)